MIRRADQIKDTDLGRVVTVTGRLAAVIPCPRAGGQHLTLEVAADDEVEVNTR